MNKKILVLATVLSALAIMSIAAALDFDGTIYTTSCASTVDTTTYSGQLYVKQCPGDNSYIDVTKDFMQMTFDVQQLDTDTGISEMMLVKTSDGDHIDIEANGTDFNVWSDDDNVIHELASQDTLHHTFGINLVMQGIKISVDGVVKYTYDLHPAKFVYARIGNDGNKANLDYHQESLFDAIIYSTPYTGIKGYVLNANSGQGISGATVSYGESGQTITDSNGFFNLNQNLWVYGQMTSLGFTVAKTGYQNKYEFVFMNRIPQTFHNFSLTPN